MEFYPNVIPFDIEVATIQGRNENIKIWLDKCIRYINKSHKIPYGIYPYVKLNENNTYKLFFNCNHCNKTILILPKKYNNNDFLQKIILSF